MWKYICESPICESTFIHGNFRSIQRISVMMQNKGGQKNCERLPFRNPQGIQCFGMVGLGFAAGSPRRNISWKGMGRLYKRPKHMNGCHMWIFHNFERYLEIHHQYFINSSHFRLWSRARPWRASWFWWAFHHHPAALYSRSCTAVVFCLLRPCSSVFQVTQCDVYVYCRSDQRYMQHACNTWKRAVWQYIMFITRELTTCRMWEDVGRENRTFRRCRHKPYKDV